MTRPPGSILALGLDPSLSCTGWAMVRHGVSGLGAGTQVLNAGAITTDGDLADRLTSIVVSLDRRLDAQPGLADLGVIGLEFPQGYGGNIRSSRDLPKYGMAVGAVFQFIRTKLPWATLMTPTADTWGKGIRTGARGGSHKVGRIETVKYLTGTDLRAGGLNAEEASGAADAILIARWAAERALYDRTPPQLTGLSNARTGGALTTARAKGNQS